MNPRKKAIFAAIPVVAALISIAAVFPEPVSQLIHPRVKGAAPESHDGPFAAKPAEGEALPGVLRGVERELKYGPEMEVRRDLAAGLPAYEARIGDYLRGSGTSRADARAAASLVDPLVSQMGRLGLERSEQVILLSQLGKFYYDQALVQRGIGKVGRPFRVRLLMLATAHLDRVKALELRTEPNL